MRREAEIEVVKMEVRKNIEQGAGNVE